MSDRVKKRGRETRVPSGLSRTDTVWQSMLAVIREIVDDTRPTMATVTTRERADGKGGNVRVKIDGDQDGTIYGAPRTRGTVYNGGDRVWVQKTKSGELVITGAVASGATDADERAIANEQIYTDAVDSRAIIAGGVVRANIGAAAVDGARIDTNQITSAHMQGNSITKRELADLAVGTRHIQPGVVNTDQMATDSVTRDRLSAAMRSDIDGKATESFVTGKLSNYYTAPTVDDRIGRAIDNAVAGLPSKNYVDNAIAGEHTYAHDGFVADGDRLTNVSDKLVALTKRVNKIEAQLGI